MPRRPDAMRPLLALNEGRMKVGSMTALTTKMRDAKIPLTALEQRTTVDPETGIVSHDMALCGFCNGNCCSTLEVPITKEDRRRIAKGLGIRSNQVPLLPLDGNENDVDAEELAGYLTKGNGPCPYFDAGCNVHAFRPDACRQFGIHACVQAEAFVPREALTKRKRRAS